MLAFEAMSPFHKFVRPLYMETKRKGNNLCLRRETKINDMANKDTRKNVGKSYQIIACLKIIYCSQEVFKGAQESHPLL